ncbi:amidohydrolase [Shewanella sp. A25]|nr:amidohydrolase [Shewanella shenzhenensis]
MKKTLLSSLIISTCFAGSTYAADLDATKMANDVEKKVIEWRRDFHQHPELSNREERTSKIVAKHLKSLGLEVQTGVAHHGVVGILKGGKPGPLIALRADMDALPVKEVNELPFASKVTTTYNGKEVGVMHACGHDAHTAMLMGVAENLVKVKDQLAGDVMFIFQPAEEGAPAGEEGGSALMLKEGLFAKRKPAQVFGMHVSPELHTGKLGLRSGPVMASEDKFKIVLTGRQIHGALPWYGVDPIVASAQIVTSMQTLVSREADLTKGPAVVSIGAINGGVRANIIPNEVEMIGTIRTFDPPTRDRIKARLVELVENSAKAHGASAKLEIEKGNPAVLNNPEVTESVRESLTKVVGQKNLITPNVVTATEDFAHYALETPGLFLFLGVTPEDKDLTKIAANHSPKFMLDENALKLGVASMTQVALTALNAK